MRSVFIAATVVSAATLMAPAAQAAPGYIDPTFGTGGETTVAFGGDGRPLALGTSTAHTAAGGGPATTLADGRLLVGAGYVEPGSARLRTALLRFTRDGVLDRTFGDGGSARSPVTLLAKPVEQADGRIVSGGYDSVGDGRWAVVRWNADGSLDRTFGGDGIAYPPAPQASSAWSVDVLPDGRVVSAGEVRPGGLPVGDRVLLARQRQNGAADPTFGGDGLIELPLDGFRVGGIGLTLQGAKPVVATTAAQFQGDWRWVLARFRADGTLDRSFGEGGRGEQVSGKASHGAFAPGLLGIEQDSLGRLITGAGGADAGPAGNFGAARWTAAGRLDRAFGTGGIASAPFDSGRPSAFAVQPDDSPIVAGGTVSKDAIGWTLVRFDRRGVLDSGFGDGGRTLSPSTRTGSSSPQNQHEAVNGLTTQRSGKIVAAGSAFECGRQVLALVRYHGDSGPGIAARGPAVSLCDRTETATGTGAVTLDLGCPSVEGLCSGTVAIQAATRITGSSRPLNLGGARFRVQGAASKSVRVALTRRGRSLLSKRRTLRARVVVTARNDRRKRRVTRHVLRLRTAK